MGIVNKIFILYHSLMIFANDKKSIRALGQYRDNMSFNALSRVVKSEDPEIRILAMESLSRLGLKATIPLFVTSLKDPNRLVSIAASNILIRTGKDVVPVLIEDLKHEEFEQRAQIIEILGKIGETSAIPAITPHIKEDEAVVRLATALALARIGDKGSISLILQGIKENKIYFSFTPSGLEDDLKSMDLYKKLFAAYPLAMSNHKEAKKTLLKLLDTNYGWTRCFIIRMFADIGVPEDIERISSMIQDEDIWVRRAAVEVLGEIGTSAVIPVLIKASNDNDSWVGASATTAIDKIKAKGNSGQRTEDSGQKTNEDQR
ncbi:MAG: HEAT repeat domain-containing protein [bacterium]|nr:HEAT repeat domain-containing protein [bacterium]MDD5756404.1 HEAT repeat domain-containing protein [bacterium]